MLIRDAVATDMVQVRDLYNALILTTTIAWSERPETLEERLAWFENQQRHGWPVLVAVDESTTASGGEDARRIVGFTAYGAFRGEGRWPGYRYTVELTIHVDERWWGRGVGRALIEALIARAESAGMHVIVAGIDGANEASIRFHERLGFSTTAVMPEVGTKFGRWLDLVLMQRVLGVSAASGDADPLDPVDPSDRLDRLDRLDLLGPSDPSESNSLDNRTTAT